MSSKKGFVDGDVLERHNALLPGQINNPVNQQKREAMRQDAENVLNIQVNMFLCRDFSYGWGGVGHSGFIRRDDYTLSHLDGRDAGTAGDGTGLRVI